jgi:hypothetical protein
MSLDRKRLVASVVLAVAIFGGGSPTALAQAVAAKKGTGLPTSLIVQTSQGKTGTSIELHNIKATGTASAGKAYAARADFHFTLAGHKMEVQKGVTVEKLTHDAKGKVSAAVIALNSDVHLPGVKSKHTGLTLVKSGKIVLGQKQGVTAVPEFQGAIHAVMPFRTVHGKQVVLSKADGVVPLAAHGIIKFKTQFSIPAAYKDGFATPAGLITLSQPLSVSFSTDASKVGVYFTASAPGHVQVSVPNLITDGGTLRVDSNNIVLDNSGNPLSFDGNVHEGHVTTGDGPSMITLVQPAGFVVMNIRGKVSYQNGVPTVFTLTGDVMLPTSVTDASGVSRVVLKDTLMDLIGSPQCIPIANPVGLFWQSSNFALNIPAATCFLDFSPTLAGNGEQIDPGDGSWMGLYIQTADLLLNTLGITLVNGGQGFYVDANGIGGSVNSISQPVGGNLYGYGFSLAQAQGQGLIQFSNNQMSSASILPASLKLPSWNGGNPDGTFPIQLTINPDGTAGVGIDPNNQPTIAYPGLGLSVNLWSCSFQTQSDNSTLLSLSGQATVSIDTLGSSAFSLNSVAVNPAGVFGGDTLNTPNVLSNPIVLGLPVFSLQLDQVQFSTYAGGTSRLVLTGGVNIGDGLPLSGQADFSGLSILTDQNGNPQIEWGAIFIHVRMDDVLGIGALDGDIGYSRNRPLANGTADTCLIGSISFSLGATGFDGNTSLGGTGTGATFLIVDADHFIVFGSFDLASLNIPPIPLGDTDLALYKFYGGFGRQMQIVAIDGPPSVASFSRLDPSNCTKYDDGRILLAAGVRIGTYSDLGYMIMADALLTFSPGPQPWLGFNSSANFFCNPSIPPGQGDINGTMILDYNAATDSFHAGATANANFPAGSDLITASGGADLLWSPSEKHFYFGGPPGASLDQYVNVSVLGELSASGQLGVMDTASVPNQVLCYANMHVEGGLGDVITGEIDGGGQVTITKSPFGLSDPSFHAHASGDVNFLIATGHGEGDLTATLPGDGNLHLSGTLSGTVDGLVTWYQDVSASISIDDLAVPKDFH